MSAGKRKRIGQCRATIQTPGYGATHRPVHGTAATAKSPMRQGPARSRASVCVREGGARTRHDSKNGVTTNIPARSPTHQLVAVVDEIAGATMPTEISVVVPSKRFPLNVKFFRFSKVIMLRRCTGQRKVTSIHFSSPCKLAHCIVTKPACTAHSSLSAQASLQSASVRRPRRSCRSDRKGLAANICFQMRGVSWCTSDAGCWPTRCSTSTK